MQLWLFDTNSHRRMVWGKVCLDNSLEFKCFEAFSAEIYQNPSSTRIVVFDQSLIGNFLNSADHLAEKLSCDIVVFTIGNCPCSTVMRLMQSGASWVFGNTFDVDALSREFDAVLKLAEELDQRLQRFKRLDQHFAELSAVENDVLKHILEGLHNKEIAQTLEVSIRTVESRRAKIYRKCDVSSVVELVRRADEYQSLKKIFVR